MKKAVIVYFSLISLFIIISVSCNVTGDNCGPFDDKFKTVSFNTDLKNISISENPGFEIYHTSFESDTIGYEQFGLAMYPIGEFYSMNSNKLQNLFSISQKAFACSLPTPVSEEIIKGIEIFSNRSFNSAFIAEDNLADLFEIVVLYRNSGYQRINLNEFLISESKVPDEIYLLLKSAPEIAEPIEFTLKYSQDGIDMNSFEFITRPVVIMK